MGFGLGLGFGLGFGFGRGFGFGLEFGFGLGFGLGLGLGSGRACLSVLSIWPSLKRARCVDASTRSSGAPG